ncbi:MAG TPA: hypothetical protein VJL84_01200 [Kiloniellales bacterium]|nr:hypothetical protein [Kiloniellales bacterium]
MIPSRAEIINSTVGGVRLLLFKPDGLQRLTRDGGAAWRSFFALILSLPALFFLLEGLRGTFALEEPGLHFYGLWLLTETVIWLAYPVLLLTMSRQLPLRMRVPFFIQALNWLLLPAQYLALAVGWLSKSTLLPHDLTEALNVVVGIWVLVAEWWLARRILAVGAGQAALLILLHFMLGYALTTWALGRTAVL